MARSDVLAQMAVRISADTAEFNRRLADTQNSLNKFVGNVGRLGNTLGVAFGATAAFSGLKYGLNVIQDFEKRMSEVKAITGATGSEFTALRDNALSLGRSTKYTAEQVAELQVAYGRLGFSTGEILKVTESTLDLATATGEDLAKSADIAGSTLRGFGLDASQMQRVIDVMAASFNKSALGLENFSEAMKYVAPVAAANNISLEETTALLGTLADNGIRGSMAGTSLRKIISDLDKGSKPLNEKLADLAAKGFSSADAMDEVGRTAYASLLTLVKYADNTDRLNGSLQNVNGEAAKMAHIMEDNLSGDVTKFTSAIDGLILSGSGLTSTMREVVQALTGLVSAFQSDESFLTKIIKPGLDQLSVGFKLLNYFLKDNEKAVDKAVEKQVALSTEIKRTNDEALTPQVGLIADLEQKLKDAEAAKKAAFTVSDIVKYNQQIESLSEKLAALNSARNQKQLDSKPAGNQTISGAGFLFDVGAIDTASNSIASAISKIDSSLINNTQSLESWAESATISFENYQNSLVDFSGVAHTALSGIGQALGAAISGSTNLGDALLGVLGGVLVQLGEMLITAGLGVEAFKKSLQSLQGIPAIVAGAALVAIGSAVASNIKSLGKNPASATASTVNGGAGSSRFFTGSNSTQDSNPKLVAVLKGQDIWIALENYRVGNGFTKA